MDSESFKFLTETAKDIHNSSTGLSFEIVIASYAIYKTVWKKVTKRFANYFQQLLTALEIHSNTLNVHTKQLGEHSDKIENHEKRIVVLETKNEGGNNG